ncbi:GNAT family N-acetyltransferase [Flammeovirga pacifica]|uniref:GNAT family N-acetyltransferase n=1 Tax=Flammeovirga pacifica TaxID=915059 RepID=A0A1S1Z1W0_FLAPC|nr:GNAT family N-acetyltransferase [Flammeovirga pacifica]OHX67256.1 GNAT family N-acetyltransferase [Flammeovirga pacifica]
MINIKRTNSENKDFIALVKLLDQELAKRDGEDHAFYAQFNTLDKIKHVVIIYDNNVAVSCGAIKPYDDNTMEVKRMFTLLESRGKGIATKTLQELEQWTKELGYQKCILETGIKQPEAIRLYQKNNYELISNYGQYQGVEESKCFEKKFN